MQVFDLIPQEELDRYQEQADLIITHGGVGSIISSLKKGKKIIAIPRLHKYKEHVNDHQKEIIEYFANKGYIMGLNSVDELKEAILNINDFTPVPYKNEKQDNCRIVKIIEEFIDKL